MSDDDLIQFLDEEPSKKEEQSLAKQSVWKILITDDEKDVHSATTFALRNTKILGRPLEFYHANSAQEAIKILQEVRDIAVIILDVVMETPNAGLDCVAIIRNQLNITDSRIILRTGQPNQAPEIEVIRDYDINDYKLKSELTQSKLYASLTTAVRSYKQIRMIEAGKQSLDMIVRSSSELLTQDGLNSFAQGVIIHLSGLLSIPPEGLICVRRQGSRDRVQPQIVAAAGHYCSLIDHPLSDLVEEEAKDILIQSLDNRCNVYTKFGLALYLGSDARGDMSCYVSSSTKIEDVDQNLLELFCTNISICADNLTLVERLNAYAYSDELTKLPNRHALTEKIDEAIEKDSGNDVLAVVDIDNFAEINATLGQKYGDDLLIAIANRLRDSFSKSAMVARVAGDTFTIFGPADAVREEDVLTCFKTPFTIDSEQQIISVTAGIVPKSEIKSGGADAIKDASIVLKLAKNENRGEIACFDRGMLDDARDRLELLKGLRHAFESDSLEILYQPKIDIATSAVTGIEALVRWRKDDGSHVMPEEFISVAEQSGLIIRLGEWIFNTCATTLAELRKANLTIPHMSVNISVAQLQHATLFTMLDDAIKKAGLEAKHFDLEITESISARNVESNVERLKKLKELGFSLSMDDFGTGYSSLSQLQKMPIDRLKIDESFVRSMDDSRGSEIVDMIIHLGHTLGVKVIAEGVENQAQLDALKNLQCDEAQGFHLAKPMNAADLRKWLSSR